MINFYGQHGDQVIELARTLHEYSMRKDYPFTRIDAVPETEAAVTELCTRAGCGTIFLDFTSPLRLPLPFAQNLLSEHFHLRTIAVSPRPDELYSRFRGAFSKGTRSGFDMCELGFPRAVRHLNVESATFT